MRCTVCTNPQVTEVDLLLSTGSSVRQVARLTGIPRSNLGRHRDHIAPTSRKFALIEGTDGPPGPPDPLAEAFTLAETARTPREHLRGLEAIRGATKLALRGRTDLAREDRELLDGNIEAAIAAFRNAGDFETRARALAGWREALMQRLDATGDPEPIDVPVVVTYDGTPTGGGAPVRLSPAHYRRGVPQRFRDWSRYAVARTVRLTWEGKDPLPDRQGLRRRRPRRLGEGRLKGHVDAGR